MSQKLFIEGEKTRVKVVSDMHKSSASEKPRKQVRKMPKQTDQET